MITLKIDNQDKSSLVVWDSLRIEQNLTSQVDNALFKVRKFGGRTYVPAINSTVEIYDGLTKIFSGTIANFKESNLGAETGFVYEVECVDHSFELGNVLVAETYEGMTIAQIINDIVTHYAPTFTTNNVASIFPIAKIVFNQISIVQCLKKLADIVKYEYYVDEDKDIHFFPKFTESAPFSLTDTNGNLVNESLERRVDGSQISNVVRVRGGEYDADLFTDKITVKGSNTKSFKLPYKFTNLTIKKNSVAQNIGIDFADTFTAKDVLYNYNERTIRWNTVLADGDVIEFSGNPKVPVLVEASDSVSIGLYGRREKIIRDDSIENLTTARQRAFAELQAYKDEADEAEFETYTAGLRTGQVINLNSSNRNINIDFIIKKISFECFTPTQFVYKVELITTRKYYLVELLQKILEPESMQANDAETSEYIKSDVAELTIVELISRMVSRSDLATITFTELISKDPIGAHVEPEWVLADYFPTSPADPKRVGALDYSLTLY